MSNLRKGICIGNRYTLKGQIGQGGFGEVWLALDEATGLDVALKLYITLDAEGIREFIAEYTNTCGLTHPNLLVPAAMEVWDNRPYLVMKYCQAGSSANLAGLTDAESLWRFVRDIAAGLTYLHGRPTPMIHQDIKPANVLIDDDGRFLITDFGISKRLSNTVSKVDPRVMGGAVAYMAPERFIEPPHILAAGDIWALGVSIYQLATGHLPFSGLGGGMQRGGAEMPSLPSAFPAALNDLMQACLDVDPDRRPTAAEVYNYCCEAIKGNPAPEKTWLTHAAAAAATVGAVADSAAAPIPVAPEPFAAPQPAPKATPETFDTMDTYSSPKPGKPHTATQGSKRSYGIIAAAVLALLLLGAAAYMLIPRFFSNDSDGEIIEQGLLADSEDEENSDRLVEEAMKATEASSTGSEAASVADDQPATAPLAAVPATYVAEKASATTTTSSSATQAPQKAPAQSQPQKTPTKLNGEGYVDPADGGYVDTRVRNHPAVRHAGRSDGLDYNPDKFANGPLPSRIGKPGPVNRKSSSAKAQAPSPNPTGAEAVRQAEKGVTAAYGPAARHLLQTGQYEKAESFAKKAKDAGQAEGDAVLNYLQNTGYYD